MDIDTFALVDGCLWCVGDAYARYDAGWTTMVTMVMNVPCVCVYIRCYCTLCVYPLEHSMRYKN